MTAETIESFDFQGKPGEPARFDDSLMNDYLKGFLGLQEGQHLTGLSIRRFARYHDNLLTAQGVRLECGVIGDNPSMYTWDIIDDSPFTEEATRYIHEQAMQPVRQETREWMGGLSVRRVFDAPLPPIKELTFGHHDR